MANRIVSLKIAPPSQSNTMDAVEYCKRHGEHLLAVNIVKYRKGEIDQSDIFEEIANLCSENDDSLINL